MKITTKFPSKYYSQTFKLIVNDVVCFIKKCITIIRDFSRISVHNYIKKSSKNT